MRRMLCVLLAASAVFSLCRLPSAASAEAPAVSASCAILTEAGSGLVLYEKNADEERKIASTTKIMTALLALEETEPDEVIEVDGRAAGVEGSSVYLSAGERITAEALLYALMLGSANDAAEALAYEIAGSIAGFAARMNDRAAKLGMTHTVYENPHGLDTAHNRSTARDLAVLTREALRNDAFRQIVSTKKKSIPLHDGSAARLLINHNRLLGEYDGMIGVKTGYTKASGRCLVTAAERGGITLLCVTLNDPQDWKDHRALLDYGFSRLERIEPVGAYEAQTVLPVVGGAAETVRAANFVPLSLITSRGEHSITVEYRVPRFLYAPVVWGTEVGEAVVYDGGKEIGRIGLNAVEGTPRRAEKRGFFARIIAFFRQLFGKKRK